MDYDPTTATVGTYYAREWDLRCNGCRLHDTVSRWAMGQDFPADTSLAEAALRYAAKKGCLRAKGAGEWPCSIAVLEIAVERWARLGDAASGHWRAVLRCRRRHAGLKSVASCPETFELDVETLCVALGDQLELFRVPSKCCCPRCGTRSIDIDWFLPRKPTRKADAAAPPTSIELLREAEFQRRRRSDG